MKDENKQLLLADLCARLPYGVMLSYDGEYGQEKEPFPLYELNRLMVNTHYEISGIKPYLRPMSSMTEEERKIYAKLLFADLGGVLEDYYKSLDYLNLIHIDYRGLIEKGLALKAPDGMYK